MQRLLLCFGAFASGCMMFAQQPASLDEIANRYGRDAMQRVKAVDEARVTARTGDPASALAYAHALIDANPSADTLDPRRDAISGRDWPALHRECIAELDTVVARASGDAIAADALAWKGLLQVRVATRDEGFATIARAYERKPTALSGMWYVRTLQHLHRDGEVDAACRATRAAITVDDDIVLLLDTCIGKDPYAAHPTWMSKADRALYDAALDRRDRARIEYERQERADAEAAPQRKAEARQRELEHMIRDRHCARTGNASAD